MLRVVLGCACLLGVSVSCTTTLDPTVLVGDGGAEPLATCSLFTLSPSEYVICPELLDFEAAAADCNRRGSTLAAIDSAAENDFVATSASGILSGNLWLGGTRDDAYVWRWPDGTVFWRGGTDGSAEAGAFVLWQPGEPNDSSTVTTDPEQCLALTPEGNDWNDRACSLGMPYVCERTPASP